MPIFVARPRVLVLFVIDLKTGKTEIAGITRSLEEAFIAQVARNLTDCFDGLLRNQRFLVLDRDSKFTEQFNRIYKDAVTKVIFGSAPVTQLQRFRGTLVLSVKSECLNKMIFSGEGSLRRACSSFLGHCHVERSHQGLGNERIERRAPGAGEVQCSERLGGILSHDSRAA